MRGSTDKAIKAFLKENKLESTIKEGEDAFKRVVNANLRLVVHIAKGFMGVSHLMNLQDLIQEGNIGLLKAVKKFKPKKGYKFSTYATWWIRRSIQYTISRKTSAVRMPIGVYVDLMNFKKTQKKIKLKTGT